MFLFSLFTFVLKGAHGFKYNWVPSLPCWKVMLLHLKLLSHCCSQGWNIRTLDVTISNTNLICAIQRNTCSSCSDMWWNLTDPDVYELICGTIQTLLWALNMISCIKLFSPVLKLQMCTLCPDAEIFSYCSTASLLTVFQEESLNKNAASGHLTPGWRGLVKSKFKLYQPFGVWESKSQKASDAITNYVN